MLTKGSKSVHASNNANTSCTLGRWIPEAIEQNLIKFILHLYYELKSTFSILGDNVFPGKRFYQHLISEMQTGSELNTDKFQTPKNVLNKSFAHSLTCYHAQMTTFF